MLHWESNTDINILGSVLHSAYHLLFSLALAKAKFKINFTELVGLILDIKPMKVAELILCIVARPSSYEGLVNKKVNFRNFPTHSS